MEKKTRKRNHSEVEVSKSASDDATFLQRLHGRLMELLTSKSSKSGGLNLAATLVPDLVQIIVEYVPSHRLFALQCIHVENRRAKCRVVCLDDEVEEAPAIGPVLDVNDTCRLDAVVCGPCIYLVDTYDDCTWRVTFGGAGVVREIKVVDLLNYAFGHIQGASFGSSPTAIWAAGGTRYGCAISDVWRFDVADRRWREDGHLPSLLSGHTITFVPANAATSSKPKNQVKDQNQVKENDRSTDNLPAIGGGQDVLVVVAGETGSADDPSEDTEFIRQCYYAPLRLQIPDDDDDDDSEEDEDSHADDIGDSYGSDTKDAQINGGNETDERASKVRRTEGNTSISRIRKAPVPVLGEWTPFASLTHERAGHATALFHGCLVVVGGGVDPIEVFRLSSPELGWVEVGALPPDCIPNGLRMLADDINLFVTDAPSLVLPSLRDNTVPLTLYDITPGRKSALSISIPTQRFYPDTLVFVPITE